MSGHNAAQQMAQGDRSILDPGSSGTIYVDRFAAIVNARTAAAEARTLAQPTKEGLEVTIVLDVDGGDLTLTVTGGYNKDADTAIVLADAGNFVRFTSVKVGSAFYWRLIAQEGTDAAVENLAVDQLTIGGTLLTSTAAELNQLDGNILADMTPGAGISPVTNSICEHSVEKVGGLYKTTILIDLTGLNSGGTAGDIIGKADTAASHLGQILAAVNGTIFAGRLTCLETPATGDDDIDLYSATEATGTEDAAIGGITSTQLCNSGNLTVGTVVPLTAFPAANKYLYLVAQTGDANATYTAGILLIELWGK